MKVLISCAGIGNGHASRSLAIGKKLEEIGFSVTYASYADGYRFLKREGAKPLYKIPKWYMVFEPDGSFNLLKTILTSKTLLINFFKQLRRLRKIVEREKIDLIISDTEISSAATAKLRKIPCIFLTNWLRVKLPTFRLNFSPSFLEDLVDKIIVPDFPRPYTLVKENLKIPKETLKKVSFVGPITRKKPIEVETIEKYEIFPEEKPLVFFSITGPGSSVNIWKNLVNKLKLVITKNFIVTVGLKKLFKKKYSNMVVSSWISAEERYKLLKVSDLLVSRAGFGTISDALAFGKKMILIPQPNQPEQITNAHSVQKRGLGIMVSQTELESLFSLLDCMLTDKNIEKNLRKYRKLCERYDGVKRSIDVIKHF
ncbi:MAG: glycosyltransferase family protein [Candidatus Nanoarchaeia archaeon]|nr:hypothetical protein [Candidatus Haiyanarchaeum thermophilum]MCW1303359.1 hypothetical protein [Candidatus Haiyanarchaeum thermophilum]MCW1303953.1 hypothetical protein [Candidatus Haiyanarchaeum thermophilum]MCW1306720.1 hypothetical protein [Candidatus Haiyanarchaeum thermophilum]MCW1307559.1 hypothetical protein [Candidatus Haiyanarchaeum thermophilum]